MKLVKFFRNFNLNSFKIDLAIQGCFCPVFILKYYLYSHAFPGDAVVKNSPVSAGDTGMQFQSLGWDNPLKWEMTTHSSIRAWKIPLAEEPDGLQVIGSQRVGHD